VAPSWHGTMLCGARRVVNHSTARALVVAVVGQAYRRPSTQARLCDVDGLTQAQLAQHGGQLFMTIDSFCQRRGLTVRDRGGGSAAITAASAPFPSWNRSILTEVYLCHACSDHVIEDGNGPPGAGDRGGGRWAAGHASTAARGADEGGGVPHVCGAAPDGECADRKVSSGGARWN
jgi:hypothetical protein